MQPSFWHKERIGGLAIMLLSLLYGSQIGLIPEIDSLQTSFTGRSLPYALAFIGIIIGAALTCQRATAEGEIQASHCSGDVFSASAS